MSLKQITKELVSELFAYNSGKKDYSGFSGFSTGKNGIQCGFDKDIELKLMELSDELYRNDNIEFRIEKGEYKKLVKKAIVELFTSGRLIEQDDSKINLKLIKAELKQIISDVRTEHIHLIPAKILNLVIKEKIVIGCVTICSIEHWLEQVEEDKYIVNESNWKENLINKINNKSYEIDGYAKEIYNWIGGANSIVRVVVKGFEQDLSNKMSRILAKTVLDMISLYLGSERAFYQQVIIDEKMGPRISYSLMEYNGFIGRTGFSLEKNAHPIFLDDEDCMKFRKKLDEFMPNFQYVLDGFSSSNTFKYPNLAQKWIYALIWYAEGVRESNDAIAVAKLASCLDTLSNGTKYAGIKKLLSNMLDQNDEDLIFSGSAAQSITLHNFVKRFYEEGRSRILHGTLEDMLESFVMDKKRLISCARIVLLESLCRLNKYDGEDVGTAFQYMK